MSQIVPDCHRITCTKLFHKLNLLLWATSASMLLVLAMVEVSTAQVNVQSGSQELLSVPRSPVPSRQSRSKSQILPPPPSATGSDSIDLPKDSLLSRAVQQTPTDALQQLENDLIQQQATGNIPATVSQQPTTSLPMLTAGGNAAELGLDKLGDTNNSANSLQQPASVGLPKNNTQTAPLPPLPGQAVTQEFTAPGMTPTFNQLLNSTAQPVAPLPPLPNTSVQQEFIAPTAPSSVSSSSGQPLTQLFSCQVVMSSPINPSGGAPNQLMNCQAVTPPLAPETATSVIEQIHNSQTPTPQSSRTAAPVAFSQSTTSNTAQSQGFPTVPSIPPRDTLPPVTQPEDQQLPGITERTVQEPSLQVQGVYISVGEDATARARVSGVYPLTPNLAVGGTLDLLSGEELLVDSRGEGLNINELFLAASVPGLPSLRFVLGQIDLTSYFDRNSFAKDGASQFFNPLFQTNPALSAAGIAPRPGFLVNWSITDNIEAKAAVFSSSDAISEFAVDGFAAELGIRYGNAIIRGTYATDRDAGTDTSFPESFAIARDSSSTIFGPDEDDREEAYGVNAEVFIPNINLGIFGRYGRFVNRDLGEGADTFLFGISVLDLFTPDDRLGLAYGRDLSSESLRTGDIPDVLELYYDFRVVPFLRLGFTIQSRENFDETVFGVRVKSEFDVLPRRSNDQ